MLAEFDPHAHGLAKVNAIVIEPILEVEGPIGELADGGPRQAFGVVDDLVHVDPGSRRTVTFDKFQKARFAGMACSELGPDVSLQEDRGTHVFLDHFPQRLVAFARLEQLQRRYAQALLIAFGRIGGVGARHSTAHVRVVTDGGSESDSLAFEIDRLEDEDVGQMHAAVEGIVQDVDIVRLHLVVVVAQNRRQRGGDRAQMLGQGEALGQHLPFAVAYRGGIVHAALQHAGICSPKNREGHLVGDRVGRVLEQLERKRIMFPGHP